MISLKQCSGCKEWKDESEFNLNRLKKSGLQNYCKKCQRERKADWSKDNKDRIWADTTIRKHRERGVNIKIGLDELIDFYNISMKKGCGICSIEMEPGNGVVSPRSPSLDIKDPTQKTIEKFDDIQIICHYCNRIKSNRTMKKWFDDNLDFVIKFQNDYQNWT